jgi:hypothetical protein
LIASCSDPGFVIGGKRHSISNAGAIYLRRVPGLPFSSRCSRL